MTDGQDGFDRFLQRYEEPNVPWDQALPPPEIVALAADLTPGRALDLGCGYGRAAIHLAERGWLADGVDFVPKAIAEARHRAILAGVSERVRFHTGSATDLSFLSPPYDLAIDVGCMHSFTEEMLYAYRDEVARLLRRGGHYVLFAHIRDEGQPPAAEGPRGIPEATLGALLSDYFLLERTERGISQIQDRPPWPSGWFWFRRL